MKYDHERKSSSKVAEPVQVYLDQRDRQRLERLTQLLDTTKSAVLRKALQALERQLAKAEDHPALDIIGIAPDEVGPPVRYDVAREHDRYFADLEDARGIKRSGRRKRAP
jgi:hypothetical protein